MAAEPERRAAQRAHGSQAASAIGSDLVPTWTGQAAAHGGHTGLAEVERVFLPFMYHIDILVGRAGRETRASFVGPIGVSFSLSRPSTRPCAIQMFSTPKSNSNSVSYAPYSSTAAPRHVLTASSLPRRICLPVRCGCRVAGVVQKKFIKPFRVSADGAFQ